MKQVAVPFIAFFDSTGPRDSYAKIEKIQQAVSATGVAQLLQDEHVEPENVKDAADIQSVRDLKQLAALQVLPELVQSVNRLLETARAPWRTLSEDPDAMKHIANLESAAADAQAILARIPA